MKTLLMLAMITAVLLPPVLSYSAPPEEKKPNIIFILTDNLGYGEIGVYGGGELRGAPTPRIDTLAGEGMRLTNMNMETQCTPSRSSIMTGRFAIRSGTYAVPFGGVADGLTQWEVTIAEALSDAGYSTALFGKWHLGSEDGRLPTDQGFDEWFGIPRTSDESFWPSSPGYAPSVIPPEMVMEGRKGEKSRKLRVYDLHQRQIIDGEITRRSLDYIDKQTKNSKPFFAYIGYTQPHMPTLPNPAFKGKTGNGDWADMLAEMDHNVGQILDRVEKTGIRDNTVVIFTSDNGSEYIKPWDGWSGPWRGGYFTAQEGGIRVPFMIRWPGKIAPGKVSNEIVHGVDLFATLAKIAGAKVPGDRPVDSRDQSAFFLGRTAKSNREGFPIWGAENVLAVKWRNWKVHFYRQDTLIDPPQKYGVPHVMNLFTDPREEKGTLDTWVIAPALKMINEFDASTKKFPLIPMGTPDPYRPPVMPVTK